MKHLDTLGKRIKAARTHNKQTQRQLAEAVGVTTRQVYRWETDEQEPTAGYIPKLAEALETTVNYLMDTGSIKRMLLASGWTPLYVFKLDADMPRTEDKALELLRDDTDWVVDWMESAGYYDCDDGDILEEIKRLFRDGWLEWFEGALVMWEDVGRYKNKEKELELLMWG